MFMVGVQYVSELMHDALGFPVRCGVYLLTGKR